MGTCSNCARTEKIAAKGLCWACYAWKRKKGEDRPLKLDFLDGRGRGSSGLTPEERFWAYVDTSGECWTWEGTIKNPGLGYGAFTVYGGLTVSAHRYAYETIKGPVPKGLELDHLCRNTLCVNPEHLEPVTHAENMRRGVFPMGTDSFHGRKTHCPHGHAYTPENTYRHGGKRQCRTCRDKRNAARLTG